MRLPRAFVLVALLCLAAYAGYRFFAKPAGQATGNTIAVYYCKTDGQTLVPWNISVGTPREVNQLARYATAQALVGPPPDVEAIRFPAGTIARSVVVAGKTVTVDLSGDFAANGGGSFAEGGEFKALVWTLTALPGIDAVQIEIGGARVPTLPGGHFELDEPLTRQSW
jgi:N-acetylmuramoyl-L-alanine amidase